MDGRHVMRSEIYQCGGLQGERRFWLFAAYSYRPIKISANDLGFEDELFGLARAYLVCLWRGTKKSMQFYGRFYFCLLELPFLRDCIFHYLLITTSCIIWKPCSCLLTEAVQFFSHIYFLFLYKIEGKV